MKLIVDIPEEIYIEKKEDYIGDTLDKAIANGTPLSEELEKVKAEIMSIGNWREHYEMPIAYLSCLTIVEHHISELKGDKE